jgi:hypothetical protein
MGAYMSFYLFVLFVLLTPGVLLTLPRGGSRITVAVVHGVVLATILYFSYKPMKRALKFSPVCIWMGGRVFVWI